MIEVKPQETQLVWMQVESRANPAVVYEFVMGSYFSPKLSKYFLVITIRRSLKVSSISKQL
jgi:hypothetical protein